MDSELITINTGQSFEEIKYEPYKLVEESHPDLNQIIPEFSFDEGNAKEISCRLIETLKLHRGYGLSANQCGIPHRVFVMGSGENYICCFNPKIISTSTETNHMEEGCLSYPFLILTISRPSDIIVEYQNEFGEIIQTKFVGLSARTFQHELDHLNGISFHERAKPLALKQGLKRREKQIKRFARELVRNASIVK